mgnify:CR=1 FL=1
MCGIIDFMKKKINGDLIISFCFCLLIILSGVMIKVNDKNKENEVIANLDENIITTELLLLLLLIKENVIMMI